MIGVLASVLAIAPVTTCAVLGYFEFAAVVVVTIVGRIGNHTLVLYKKQTQTHG